MNIYIFTVCIDIFTVCIDIHLNNHSPSQAKTLPTRSQGCPAPGGHTPSHLPATTAAPASSGSCFESRASPCGAAGGPSAHGPPKCHMHDPIHLQNADEPISRHPLVN